MCGHSEKTQRPKLYYYVMFYYPYFLCEVGWGVGGWGQCPFHKSLWLTNVQGFSGWNSISSFLFHHCFFPVLHQWSLALHHGPHTCNQLWAMARKCCENTVMLSVICVFQQTPAGNRKKKSKAAQMYLDIQMPTARLLGANVNNQVFCLACVWLKQGFIYYVTKQR